MDIWSRNDINYHEKQKLHNEQLEKEKINNEQIERQRIQNEQKEAERQEKEKLSREQETERIRIEQLMKEKRDAELLMQQKLTPEKEAERREQFSKDRRGHYKDAYRKYQAAVADGEFTRVPAVKDFITRLDNKDWSAFNNIPPQLKYFAGEISFAESCLIRLPQS